MKKTASFLFAMTAVVVAPFLLCSCSDDDESFTGGGSSGSSVVLPSDLDEASLPFVGEWSGMGPYHASGTPYSSYGVVDGTWRFYNDGTYYWKGENSYGYSYSENGTWHYSPESKLLITDGSCGLIWEVEDQVDGQWVGTLRTKGGTYVYKKTDAGIEAGDVSVIDYGDNKLFTRSSIENLKLAGQAFKFGVCYGAEDNLDPDTYVKVYADSVSFDTGLFGVTLKGLDYGKYRLRSFVEFADGTLNFGDEYRAICIKPAENFVFLGETHKYMWVWFYGKSALASDGSFVPEGTCGDEIAVDDVGNLLDRKRFGTFAKEEMEHLSSLPIRIITDTDGSSYVHISSLDNQNELVLPYDESMWYYTSWVHSGSHLMFRFYYRGLSSEYRTDEYVHILPVMRYTVRW